MLTIPFSKRLYYHPEKKITGSKIIVTTVFNNFSASVASPYLTVSQHFEISKEQKPSFWILLACNVAWRAGKISSVTLLIDQTWFTSHTYCLVTGSHMSSAMISDITHIKRDMGDLLSDISLHQLSVALSVKNRKRVESRCVALLAYYSFSLNSPSLQSSVVKLGPQFSSKGRIREATRAIHFLLALCGRKHFNGCTKQKQGNLLQYHRFHDWHDDHDSSYHDILTKQLLPWQLIKWANSSNYNCMLYLRPYSRHTITILTY